MCTAARQQLESTDVNPLVQTLQDSIATLRHEGRFEHASKIADNLLDLLRGNPNTKPYQLTDAEWLKKSLQLFTGLPESARSKMRTADSLLVTFAGLRKERKLHDATRVFERAVRIREDVMGSDHPTIAADLQELGSLYNSQSAYPQAHDLLRRALASQEDALGHEHPDLARTMTALAQTLPNLGRYAEADSFARESLRIRKKVFGDDHPELAFSLNALAIVAWRQNDFVASELFDRRRLALLLKHFDGGSPQVVAALHDLAVTLNGRGDYIGALDLYRQATDNITEKYGKDHFYVAFTASNMADPLTQLGRYDEAEQLLRNAEPHFRDNMGEKSHARLNVLGNLGNVLTYSGQLDEAEPIAREVLELRRETLDPESEFLAESLRSYGRLLHARGQHDDASVHIDEAITIIRKRLGAASPQYAAVLSEKAALLLDAGQFSNANQVLIAACAAFENARRRVSVNSLERAGFTASLSPYALLALTHLRQKEPNAAWNAVEKDRARSLLDMLATKSFRELTPEEERRESNLAAKLARHDETIAALDDGEQRTFNLDSLRALRETDEAEWQRFQKNLAAKYPLAEGSSFPIERVQKHLAPNALVLGWLDLKDERFAYVLRDHGDVAWTALPKVASSVYDELASHLRRRSADPVRTQQLAQQIYDARIRPVLPHLSDAKQLFVVPSGEMLALPLEALISNASDPASANWEISYTPSATVLAWLMEQPQPTGKESLLALGDPLFDEANAPTGAAASPRSPEQRTLSVERAPPQRFPRLSATRKEVQEIAALFEEKRVLLGRETEEQELRRITESGDIKKYRYLHFATHAIPDPLRGERSALVLSQTNIPDIVESIANGTRPIDGKLTMEEVMRDWELDTDLVTLSACETGLGETQTGEGYIGFAHAFFRAGTRSMLVSLWRVADRPTRLLMIRFYQNCISKKMGKSAALREAKLWLRDYTTKQGRQPFHHPSNWAAFILLGRPD